MTIIHGGAAPPFVRKALIFCEDKGIAVEQLARSTFRD